MKEISDVRFGTRLSVRLIEGVRLIGGPLNIEVRHWAHQHMLRGQRGINWKKTKTEGA